MQIPRVAHWRQNREQRTDTVAGLWLLIINIVCLASQDLFHLSRKNGVAIVYKSSINGEHRLQQPFPNLSAVLSYVRIQPHACV